MGYRKEIVQVTVAQFYRTSKLFTSSKKGRKSMKELDKRNKKIKNLLVWYTGVAVELIQAPIACPIERFVRSSLPNWIALYIVPPMRKNAFSIFLVLKPRHCIEIPIYTTIFQRYIKSRHGYSRRRKKIELSYS